MSEMTEQERNVLEAARNYIHVCGRQAESPVPPQWSDEEVYQRMEVLSALIRAVVELDRPGSNDDDWINEQGEDEHGNKWGLIE